MFLTDRGIECRAKQRKFGKWFLCLVKGHDACHALLFFLYFRTAALRRSLHSYFSWSSVREKLWRNVSMKYATSGSP